jgi:hypothetical protein
MFTIYIHKSVMVRKTKSGKDDKRSTSSATNAAKARQKLSSYVAKGKKMREEAEDEDFDIHDSDFDSEPEQEPVTEPEPEPVKEPVNEPEPEPKVELQPEKNTFKSVRQVDPTPVPVPEPIKEPEPKYELYEPIKEFTDFQKQKYISMSQMLRKSILRY